MQQNLLVDYLVMSFKMVEGLDDFPEFLFSILNFPKDDAEKIKSYYGLRECLYYAGIKIHIGQEFVVLDMSGKGCRTCEELNEGWNWYRFLNWFDYDMTEPVKDSDYHRKGQYLVHISRIDIACDLLEDDRITLPFLQRYVQQGKMICKSDYHTCVIGNHEMAIYFGSPRSDRRLRVYDKALEQGLENSAKWVRFEFQLRNDNATSFYLNLSQVCGGDFAKCYYGMLHDYLRFTTKPNMHDHNQSTRLKVCPWWSKFLQGVGKIGQLYLPGNEYDIGTATHIYSKQMSSTVRTIMEASGGDLTGIIETAKKAPLNKKQREALEVWNRQKSENEKASENGAAILEKIGESKLTRTQRLMLWKADDDLRKQKERRSHWAPLGVTNGKIVADDEKEMEEMAALNDEDLPF